AAGRRVADPGRGLGAADRLADRPRAGLGTRASAPATVLAAGLRVAELRAGSVDLAHSRALPGRRPAPANPRSPALGILRIGVPVLASDVRADRPRPAEPGRRRRPRVHHLAPRHAARRADRPLAA